MATIGVLYATRHGHAGKIAERIAHPLREGGHDVRVVRCPVLFRPELDVASLDAVVLGGSMYLRHHPPELGRFIRRHRKELEARPTAFFSVSLSAASKDAALRDSVRRLVDARFARSGWKPALTALFGGELAYTRYPLPLRLVMRAIAWRGGGPTDTSRDHVLTDWEAVEAFAHEVDKLVAERGEGRRAA
ncbi:MAG: protoporphyrinogen oxidase [Polyangiaceae bacterium]|nr:protoporphyrinogen oxidase [Polyangiaceae bacterium]